MPSIRFGATRLVAVPGCLARGERPRQRTLRPAIGLLRSTSDNQAGPQANPLPPHPDTLGSGGCGKSCRRWGLWPQSSQRSTWPPSGTARSLSSPGVDRGSHARHWRGASPLRGDERRLRPPASGGARPPARLRVAASPPSIAGRAGWLRLGSSYWRRGCKAPWCRAWRDPGASGSREYRHLARGGAWRSCAAVCVATRAS
jgi:hypothetical protein